MTNRSLLVLTIALLVPACAFAIDGQVVINQSAVMAAGGFPYKITQPGSYKLSGNLTVGPLTDGIDISTDNVTLDLNGFAITGSGAGAAGDGIFSPKNHITLKNGTITAFLNGVNLPAGGHTVADIKVITNARLGMLIGGIVPAGGMPTSVVVRCTAHNNGFGFVVTAAAMSDSAASQNNSGIVAVDSTVIHNIASNNGTGLSLTDSLFGSNTMLHNSANDLISDAASHSQNNNLCTAGVC